MLLLILWVPEPETPVAEEVRREGLLPCSCNSGLGAWGLGPARLLSALCG